MAFEEPETLVEFDRCCGNRQERLVLEKGEYRGHPTYALRVLWRADDDGTWRWSADKPTSSGRKWQTLSLKARELRALGLTLIAESDALECGGPAQSADGRTKQARKPRAREQRGLDRFDAEHPPMRNANDDGIPF